MNPEKSKEQNNSFRETSQTQDKTDPSQTTFQDPANKYSFNSYHMNIISGNRHVQGVPATPPAYQNSNSDGLRYYSQPPVYQQQMQYPQTDIQGLLNNMYVVLDNQSKLLNYLIEKNDHNFDTTNKIYKEITTDKKQDEEEPQEKCISRMKSNNFNSEITSNDLISILYGAKKSFKYSLIVDNTVPFQNLLYRQRNFTLQISLIDENKKLYSNSNRIPISLALYTVENPPKFLESNTLGNKMLKGYTQQDLINGVCLFQKIQIKQVTSHYRKNMLFLVAYAKVPSMNCSEDSNYVDYESIRPLVIDKVVVKAKKMKSRGKHKVVEAPSVTSPVESLEAQKIFDGDNSD